MSELLENFSVEDLITPKSSSTVSPPELDISSMDLNFDFSDLPDFPDNLSTPSIDPSVSYFDSSYNAGTGLFNDSGSSFNSFASSNTSQSAPQQFMPMYAPQYPLSTSAFGYQPPPGFMLVPASSIYAPYPMMPMMMQPPMQMPMQNPSFSFAPPPDAPAFPSFGVGVEEPEPMSDITVSTPVKRSRRVAGKKSTCQDSPSASPTPAKRQKVSRSKKVDRPAFELAAPMSVLTADSDLPIKNMLAVASRSVAVRFSEAKKADKILRSLNSFVCYRTAYADRIKQWASDENHQNVSRIAGASWKLEPEDVRAFYIQCAEVDKANHLKAFPGYKYNPNQPRSKKTSRSARSTSPESSDDDDEPTPEPNKKKQLVPRTPVDDDRMTSFFGDSPALTLSKYNLRRRS